MMRLLRGVMYMSAPKFRVGLQLSTPVTCMFRLSMFAGLGLLNLTVLQVMLLCLSLCTVPAPRMCRPSVTEASSFWYCDGWYLSGSFVSSEFSS